MINKEVFELTENGLQNLKDELEHLKNVDRPANIEAIKEARAQGDLSENADYASAKEEQVRIEDRINEIENILKNYKIITKDTSNKVTAGKKVNVLYVDSGMSRSFEIVGTIEADPFKGKISNNSPLGKAIIGHSAGETCIVTTESNKELKVKIVTVE